MFFSFTKLAGALAAPMTLLTFALFASILIMAFTSQGWFHRLGKRIGILAVLLLMVIATTPVGFYAVSSLENMYANVKLPKKVTGIVVVAADENPTISETRRIPVAGNAAQRYIHLKRLAKTYPHAKIVLVGDTTMLYPAKKVTTKKVIQSILDTIGVPRYRTQYETKSRNTHENAVFAAKKVKPSKKDNWLLVTSASHMPRTLLCFKKAGWNVTPAPSDYFTSGTHHFHFGLDMAAQIRLLNVAAHEYYGLLAYWMMGWIDKPW